MVALRPAAFALTLALGLSACGNGDDGPYPALLPLDVATADPGAPATAPADPPDAQPPSE